MIRLQRLSEDPPFGRLTPSRGRTYEEAASVVLSSVHQSPAELHVDTETPEVAQLCWARPPEHAQASWGDPQEATEDGASGIALLVAESVCGYVFHQRAPKYTGCDFYLAPPGQEPRMFQPPTMRLEVSGIGPNTQQQSGQRVNRKVDQARRGGDSPFMVIVVDFSIPRSTVKQHDPA